jgi:hypothetical protein
VGGLANQELADALPVAGQPVYVNVMRELDVQCACLRGRRTRFVRGLRRTFAVAVGVLVFGAATAVVTAAPAAHTCGYFFKKGNDVIVFESGPVSCAHATLIVRAFWSGVGVKMHGTSDATSYFTIRAWPGWRCSQAAGAGQCTKQTATASYKVKGKA